MIVYPIPGTGQVQKIHSSQWQMYILTYMLTSQTWTHILESILWWFYSFLVKECNIHCCQFALVHTPLTGLPWWLFKNTTLTARTILQNVASLATVFVMMQAGIVHLAVQYSQFSTGLAAARIPFKHRNSAYGQCLTIWHFIHNCNGKLSALPESILLSWKVIHTPTQVVLNLNEMKPLKEHQSFYMQDSCAKFLQALSLSLQCMNACSSIQSMLSQVLYSAFYHSARPHSSLFMELNSQACFLLMPQKSKAKVLIFCYLDASSAVSLNVWLNV